MRKVRSLFRAVPLYTEELKQRRRTKRTSIGFSKNSFGAGCNKRDTRKKYRGQGKQICPMVKELMVAKLEGHLRRKKRKVRTRKNEKIF